MKLAALLLLALGACQAQSPRHTVVLRYNAAGDPIDCWIFEGEPASLGGGSIWWLTDDGKDMQISPPYGYAVAKRGRTPNDAAGDLGVHLENCIGGRYVAGN